MKGKAYQTAGVDRYAEDIAAQGRKIIHLDMDAFYASVEQRDDPALRGQPIAVTDPRGWGIVATASYEARALGVRAGTNASVAAARWRELRLVEPRFAVYEAISEQAHKIYERYCDCIEPIFLDEAYLDVTEKTKKTTATELARKIRAAIYNELGLIVSAGVSYNKFLAKLASEQCKPDGLLVIPPGRAAQLVDQLSVGKFHGIGPATEARMMELGINTGQQLRAAPLDVLVEEFGKSGRYFYEICRGIDERPVTPPTARRSHGVERSFKQVLRGKSALYSALVNLVAEVWEKCELNKCQPRTVTVKVRFADFRQVTKSQSVQHPLDSIDMLQAISERVLLALALEDTDVRLLGLSASSLTSNDSGAAVPNQLCFDL